MSFMIFMLTSLSCRMLTAMWNWPVACKYPVGGWWCLVILLRVSTLVESRLSWTSCTLEMASADVVPLLSLDQLFNAILIIGFLLKFLNCFAITLFAYCLLACLFACLLSCFALLHYFWWWWSNNSPNGQMDDDDAVRQTFLACPPNNWMSRKW